jgi:hypothetical protein
VECERVVYKSFLQSLSKQADSCMHGIKINQFENKTSHNV